MLLTKVADTTNLHSHLDMYCRCKCTFKYVRHSVRGCTDVDYGSPKLA